MSVLILMERAVVPNVLDFLMVSLVLVDSCSTCSAKNQPLLPLWDGSNSGQKHGGASSKACWIISVTSVDFGSGSTQTALFDYKRARQNLFPKQARYASKSLL